VLALRTLGLAFVAIDDSDSREFVRHLEICLREIRCGVYAKRWKNETGGGVRCGCLPTAPDPTIVADIVAGRTLVTNEMKGEAQTTNKGTATTSLCSGNIISQAFRVTVS
jgi:hypothetical protein